MKKILLTLVGLFALMSIHAQVVEIYRNGQLMQAFYNTPNSQYEVVFKSSGDQETINGHEYIEIAGRKWATMNVGATTVAGSPETAYGDYYTWGETDTYYNSLTETGIIFKSNATGTHIKGKKTGYNYPNYCGSTQFTEWKDYPAPTGVLGEDYDVAHKEWGSTWHMPTIHDFQSLHEACGGTGKLQDAPETITKGGVYWVHAGTKLDGTTYGVAGALFVTTEDITKRLFFPMAGNLQGAYQNAKRDGVGTLCTYWSSSAYPSNPSLAQNFSVSTLEHTVLRHHINLGRYFGFSIRPVAD